MTLHDLAFPVGPVGAMFVWPLAVVALMVASRRSIRARRTGAWLSLGVAMTWFGYWALQQLEFGYVAGQESVPTLLSAAVTAAAAVCAIGVVALVASVTIAVAVSRRTPGEAGPAA